MKKFAALMSSCKLGSPEERDTFQGPQGDKLQQQRVLALIEDGKANGQLILGGGEANVNGKVNVLSNTRTRFTNAAQGAYVQPTIFKNVNEESRIAREEIFGPVVMINSFESEEDVLQRANNSEFGLFGMYF